MTVRGTVSTGRLCRDVSLTALAVLLATGASAQTAPQSGTSATAEPAPGQQISPKGLGDQAAGEATAAQDAAQQGDTPNEVVVTGFRGSLEKALDLKRTSAAAVDSILAEDIGKFPDLNLSESIQRIPGVALARDGGEGRSISVRGLGAQFTRVRINGMEAIATAGGSDASGGTNRGRGFDFNVFAADLFNAITVRKTAEATTEEGSLGATVDLRTARPFDYQGFKIAASAQASYNDLAEKTSPRAAFLISDTTPDGKFGALISVAYTKRKLIEEGYSTVRWTQNLSNPALGSASSPPYNGAGVSPGFESVLGSTCTVVNGVATPAICQAADIALHPRFPRYDYFIQDQDRLGATASLQWKPTDRTTVSIDGLYADFKAKREERYLEANGFSVAGACTAASRPTNCGIADTNVLSETITNNVLVKGTFDDVDLRTENRFDRLDTKFKQITGTVEQKFGDSVSVLLLGGHSESFHNNPIQNTITFDQYNVDGYSYDYTDRNHPVFGFGTANLANQTGSVLSQIRLRAATARNTYDTGQANLTWKVTDGFTVDAGGSYKSYGFRSTDLRRSNGTTAAQDTNLACCTLLGDTLDKFGKVVTIEGQSYFGPNYFAARDYFGLESPTARNGAFRLGIEPGLAGNVSVNEHDKGGYIQASFDKTLADDMKLRGNFGTRYVQTFQRSQGFSFSSGAAVPLTVRRTYDDFLPSANVVLEPTSNFVIRVAAARVVARPDLTSIAPTATVAVSGANRTASVGNPNLLPYRANTYDASVEWYYQTGALLSLAIFQKDIDSFVQSTQSSGRFSDNPFGLPDSLAVAACGTTPNCSPNDTNWVFTAPRNTPGGRLRGFEINFQQPFRFLPGFLGNFGTLLNFTYVKSSIAYLLSSGAIYKYDDLTGLSRKGANATLYYEDKLISARVSAAYRSRYLTDVVGTQGVDRQGTNATTNIDASAQLTLTQQIKLTFEGINLTDQYQDQFVDSRNLLSVYHHTGREFLFGVRFNL